MPKLQFSHIEVEKLQEGNHEAVASKIKKHLEEGNSVKFSDIQKLSFKNKDRVEQYKFELKNRFPKNSKVSFAVDQAEAGKQADTISEVATQALLRDNTLLARVNLQEFTKETPFIKLREFDAEKDAEVLAAAAAGTPANDTIRVGDTLMPAIDSNASKVQASFEINDLSEYFLDSVSLLGYQERLTNRVKNKAIERMFFAGNGEANGTARQPGQIRGIVNNYGVNGTGDAANYIGAIEYADKAAVDAALGVASANVYDLLVSAKAILLPKNVSEAEESLYVYAMNRKTWGKIKTVKDANGRYLAHSAVDPLTGKVTPMIDGTPVVIHTCFPDDKVLLCPPSFYTLGMVGGIRSINDNGLVQIKEGITTFVTKTYIDGSMKYGHKYKSGTAATIGTTAVDNQDQNAFRYFGIN